MRAQPFMRPAMKDAEPQALKIVSAIIKKEITAELKKLQKKGASAFKKAGKA